MRVRACRLRAGLKQKGSIRGVVARASEHVFKLRAFGTTPWELPGSLKLYRALKKALDVGEELEVELHYAADGRRKRWRVEALDTPRPMTRGQEEKQEELFTWNQAQAR